MILKSTYPCCGKPARLRTIDGVTTEICDRHCTECDTRWSVRRVTLPNKVKGVRIDRLEWLDTKSHEYVRKYAS
jgi:hypothetical protein